MKESRASHHSIRALTRTGALAGLAGLVMAGCATWEDRVSLTVAPTADARGAMLTCKESVTGSCVLIRGPGPAITVREGASALVPNLTVGSPYCISTRPNLAWKDCRRYTVAADGTTHSLALKEGRGAS